jgi:hypothetical protein
MGKVALKLNGKPLDLNPPTPAADRLLTFLISAPVDEVFTEQMLAEKAKASARHLSTKSERFSSFTLLVNGKRYWGSAKAIAELRRQTQ